MPHPPTSEPASVPVEEYLRTSYDPDMEYVDGELLERHVGEGRHSRLQTLIIMRLGPHERERKFCVLTEQRVRVSGPKHRYRIPDVCVMAMPYRIERVVTIPPHLAIEIVSPDDKAAGILRKVSDYLYFGVPHIWIVNPYKHTVQEADREDIRPCPSLVVETELVGPVDFNELFAQIDRESIE